MVLIKDNIILKILISNHFRTELINKVIILVSVIILGQNIIIDSNPTRSGEKHRAEDLGSGFGVWQERQGRLVEDMIWLLKNLFDGGRTIAADTVEFWNKRNITFKGIDSLFHGRNVEYCSN